MANFSWLTLYSTNLSFLNYVVKNISANVTVKNFIAFGAGMKSCAGADFSKVLMAVFLHVFVTKYRYIYFYVHAHVARSQLS